MVVFGDIRRKRGDAATQTNQRSEGQTVSSERLSDTEKCAQAGDKVQEFAFHVLCGLLNFCERGRAISSCLAFQSLPTGMAQLRKSTNAVCIRVQIRLIR